MESNSVLTLESLNGLSVLLAVVYSDVSALESPAISSTSVGCRGTAIALICATSDQFSVLGVALTAQSPELYAFI